MRPANDRVDVWLVPLDRAIAELGDRLALLTDAERARAERFTRAHDAAEFVMVRSTLRGLLGRSLGVPAARVVIRDVPGRKPALAADVNVRFSVSHTGGLATIAIACGREVGVDVERVEPIELAAELPGFGADELRAIRSAPEPLAAFYRAWTLKEALLKASGAGMGGAMPEIALHHEEQRAGAFVARSIDVGSGYHAALAVELGEGEPYPRVVLHASA